MAKRKKKKPVSRPVKFGEVAPGWRLRSWIERLRYLANACRVDHPGQADRYDRWADSLDMPTAPPAKLIWKAETWEPWPAAG